MFDKNKVKLGIAPIAWTNDDLPDLGKENTFEQCVSEMALAGFTGSEVGNKYPKDPEVLKKALELREKIASNRYDDIVGEITRYIEKNYADEDLSLNLLASHVNFSPNHLSMIFSQQTGQTFIKYLTDFRMNKAKELLRCSGKRSSIICMEVGYKDPHYFSYLFKKTQGMTPTQYRGGKSTEGDE